MVCSRARASCDSGARYSSTHMEASAPATDPAAQLVQLGEAHAFGILDHHEGRIGHIHADLDHRGGHQQLDAVGLEGRHGRFLLGGRLAAMHQLHCQFRQCLAQGDRGLLGGLVAQLLGLIDEGTDPVGLAA